MPTLFVVTLGFFACSDPKTLFDEPKHVEASCGRPMEAHVEVCIETTNNRLSEREVGIADVSEHDVPDGSGDKTRRVIADLVIFDPATEVDRREKVSPGEIVAIGADEYCVVDAREGKGDERGTVSLQKISK